MAMSQSNQYKNEKRNRYKMLAREAMFIEEYVQIKYKDIYQEAASMYNQINQNNTMKPDLRKTVEFRRWKNTIAAANNQPLTPVPRQKPYIYNRTVYRNIPMDTTTTISPQQITGSPPDIPVSNRSPTESPVPQNTNEKQIDARVTGRTMCLNIPLMQIPAAHKSIQPPEGILTAATKETVMEEGDQTEDLDPTIFDQLSPEIMENLINQLQADPNLKSLMDNIENNVEQEANIEEELIGLTIDLPELHDPLEEESMFW